MAGFTDLLLKSASTLVDPYGAWFPQMVESYKARSEWEKTHPPEMMQGVPKIMEEKPELDPVRGFLASMVPPDPRVEPQKFRERVHEELAMVPLMFAAPALRAAKPSMSLNLLKRAGKGIPKHLEKSLLVGAKKYAKDYVGKYGENVFEGITKKNLRFDGIMDYGEAGKRALFTIIKRGDPRDGLTFSGPRIQKALKTAIGKGLKNKKTKIFVARPGQTQHLDIFEALPPDLQGSVKAGYMVGNKFVPKAVLEKPSKATKTLLIQPGSKSDRISLTNPYTGEVIIENTTAKNLTDLVKRGHARVLRKGHSVFLERRPLRSVEMAPTGERSLSHHFPGFTDIELLSPLKRDLLHELHHYEQYTIPIVNSYVNPAWKAASEGLKKYVRDMWGPWYKKNAGYTGKKLEEALAKELTAQMHTPRAYVESPEFLKGVLESPTTVKVVNSMQRALYNIGSKQRTPLENTLRRLAKKAPGSKSEELAEKAAKSLNEYIDFLPDEVKRLGLIGAEAFERDDMVAMKRVMREMNKLGVSDRQTAKIVAAIRKMNK